MLKKLNLLHTSLALAALLCLAAVPACAQQAPTYETVKTLPCKVYLPLSNTDLYPFVIDPIVDQFGKSGNAGAAFYGSQCNINSFIEAECKLHPAYSVGDAVADLLKKQTSKSPLPHVSRCGA